MRARSLRFIAPSWTVTRAFAGVALAGAIGYLLVPESEPHPLTLPLVQKLIVQSNHFLSTKRPEHLASRIAPDAKVGTLSRASWSALLRRISDEAGDPPIQVEWSNLRVFPDDVRASISATLKVRQDRSDALVSYFESEVQFSVELVSEPKLFGLGSKRTWKIKSGSFNPPLPANIRDQQVETE